MDTLTREQFAEAVASSISAVDHLYREVDLLLSGLREELAEEPEPLVLKGPLNKASRADSRRVIVRYDFPALFEASSDDAPIDDLEADEEDDEIEDVVPDGDGRREARKKARRRSLEIAANQPLLAVRLAMFDPRREAFEPQIQFAVMSEWSLGSVPASADDRFIVTNIYMLRRISRELADRVGVAAGTRVQTNATARRSRKVRGDGRRLSCVLPHGVETVPLYSITGPQALADLATKMKEKWQPPT